jgi:hypothetical protein
VAPDNPDGKPPRELPAGPLAGERPGRASEDMAHPAAGGDSWAPGEGISEEEAIRSLAGRLLARDDSARAGGILEQLFRRLGDDPTLRVGSINVFNDEISVEEGDFAIGSGSGRSPAGLAPGSAVPLDNPYLRRHIGTYVRPGGFMAALDMLRRSHLLILCGPAGSGREAAAVALLAEAGSREQMHMLAGPLLLQEEEGWRCGPAGTAFLVPAVTGHVVGRIDDVWLQKTARLLSSSSNYMVVVAEAACGALAAASSRSEFTFEELGMPDPLTVMRRRAREVVAPTLAMDLKAWLASEEVAALIAEDSRPRSAARVGTLIAEAVNEHRDQAATLQALLDPARRVQAWFARMDTSTGADYQQIVFPVAVSVLEESSYLTVSDAAAALYLRLFPELDEPPPLRFRRALADQQQWIELVLPVEAASLYGDPPAELLRFRSPRLRAAVLEHAWTWVDGMRPALTGWLRELARHPDVDVRTRAAASTGLLATLDFSYVLHRFIFPWAVSPSPAARACAALALAVPGHSPRYSARVWSILRDWAANLPEGPGSRLPWTAAEAAGGALGRSHPADALIVLGEVLERDDWDCVGPLAVAVLNLAENGCLREVLQALLDWSEPMDGSPPVLKALLSFILTARTPALKIPGMPAEATPSNGSRPHGARGPSRITGTAVTVRAASSADASGDMAARPTPTAARTAAPSHGVRSEYGAWPVLLREADHHRTAVRDLWGRALAAKPVRLLALEALRSWLELADRDEAALAPVSRVIEAVARLGGKHPERMEYYLERWAADLKKPVRSAQRVLAVVVR